LFIIYTGFIKIKILKTREKVSNIYYIIFNYVLTSFFLGFDFIFLFYIIMNAPVYPSNISPHESHRNKTLNKIKSSINNTTKNARSSVSNFFKKIKQPKPSKIFIGEPLDVQDIQFEKIGGKRKRRTRKNKNKSRRRNTRR